MLFRDETAATAIEYGFIAAGISVVTIAVVNTLGITSTLNSAPSARNSAEATRIATALKETS